jgi:alpha-L-rhamnosidase
MHAHENTPYGFLSASWNLDENTITMEVTIPVNTTAEIHIPTSDSSSVQENGQGVRAETVDGYAVIKVGSGTYTFTAKK